MLRADLPPLVLLKASLSKLVLGRLSRARLPVAKRAQDVRSVLTIAIESTCNRALASILASQIRPARGEQNEAECDGTKEGDENFDTLPARDVGVVVLPRGFLSTRT